MTPIQQIFLGLGGADKTYIDDVFKTWLYTGAGETQTITNGMDLSASGDGGMVWIKCRSTSNDHNVFDTVRGVNKVLSTSQQYPYGAEGTMGGGLQQQFYELREESNRYIQTVNKLKKDGRIDDLRAYMQNNAGVARTRPQILALDRYMSNWRTRRPNRN